MRDDERSGGGGGDCPGFLVEARRVARQGYSGDVVRAMGILRHVEPEAFRRFEAWLADHAERWVSEPRQA